MEPMTTEEITAGLSSAICDWHSTLPEGQDFVSELDTGPEPGVILLTWASGAEFTIIVKEG